MVLVSLKCFFSYALIVSNGMKIVSACLFVCMLGVDFDLAIDHSFELICFLKGLLISVAVFLCGMCCALQA